MRKLCAATAMLLLAWTGSAAGMIINADDYEPGTDVSNAVPGMTLSWITTGPGFTDMQHAPVIVMQWFTTERNILGSGTTMASGHAGYVRQWLDGTQGALEVSFSGLHVAFDEPVSLFEFGGFSNPSERLEGVYFDAHGDLIFYEEMTANALDWFLVDLDGVPVDTLGEASYAVSHLISGFDEPLASSGIMGGYSAGGYINWLGVPAEVPAPGAGALMVLGLGAVLLVRRRTLD